MLHRNTKKINKLHFMSFLIQIIDQTCEIRFKVPAQSVTYWLLFQLCAFSDPGINGGVRWECYPECLFVISTQCHCVSASRLPSQINFEDADCFVIHTPCQVQIACCVLWLENQRWRKTRNESLSYLKKHFNTSNCKRKRGEKGGGVGGVEKGRGDKEEKKAKWDY